MPANKRARRRAWACRLGVHRPRSLIYAWNGLRCKDCRAVVYPGVHDSLIVPAADYPKLVWGTPQIGRSYCGTSNLRPFPGAITTRADEADRRAHQRATGEGPYGR